MTTTTAHASDIAVVQSAFEALGRGDLAGFGATFHPDATWHHRNDDRLGGRHVGRDKIIAFVEESAVLTAGTLRPVPEAFLGNDQGYVAVLVRVSGTRPDGRSFDNPQVLLFEVADHLVRQVDQFVGDPAAVKAFWA